MDTTFGAMDVGDAWGVGEAMGVGDAWGVGEAMGVGDAWGVGEAMGVGDAWGVGVTWGVGDVSGVGVSSAWVTTVGDWLSQPANNKRSTKRTRRKWDAFARAKRRFLASNLIAIACASNETQFLIVSRARGDRGRTNLSLVAQFESGVGDAVGDGVGVSVSLLDSSRSSRRP